MSGPLALSVGLVVVGLVVIAGLRFAQTSLNVPAIALIVLGLFGGYAVLNRNFAELNVPLGSLPLYIGELTLLVALPWALSYRAEVQRLVREPFFVAMLVWQTYCGGRLLAGGVNYGIDALRDSAIWYYGLYAIIGYILWPLVPRKIWLVFFTVAFLGLIAVSASFALVGAVTIPIPGGDPRFPTRVDRADVMAAGLVAGATFFLLVIRNPRWYAARVLLASVCLALLLPLEVRAASIGFLILLGFLAYQRRWRTLAPLTLIPVSAVMVVLVVGLPVSGRYGTSSSGGLIERQLSTLPLLFQGQAASSDPNVDTAAWRVAWWRALLNETLSNTQTTLVGAGFGADLTGPLRAQFGVQTDESGRPVRSPHNILINLFARTGLVGLGLWLVMQWTWFVKVLRAIGHGRRAGMVEEADLLLWLFGYAVLILVSATLGVVLEGPYGAIPYFLVVGMSLRCAAHLSDAVERAPQPALERAPVALVTGRRRRAAGQARAPLPRFNELRR
jgi:hypothetical protein